MPPAKALNAYRALPAQFAMQDARPLKAALPATKDALDLDRFGQSQSTNPRALASLHATDELLDDNGGWNRDLPHPLLMKDLLHILAISKSTKERLDSYDRRNDDSVVKLLREEALKQAAGEEAAHDFLHVDCAVVIFPLPRDKAPSKPATDNGLDP